MCLRFLIEKGKQLQEALKYVMYTHIGVAILLMFVYSTFDGIIELISPAILYWGIYQKNYWSLLIYFILDIFNAITKLFLLISLWSNYGFADSFNSGPIFNIAILLVISFYITASIITFISYKEFKAWAEPHPLNNDDYEANQELSSVGGPQRFGGVAGGYQPPQPQLNNIRNTGNTGNSNSNFHAFSGQGVRLGGGQ